MHGYAIARRIEQVSGDSLQLSQGSVYPALIRLAAGRLDHARNGEFRKPTGRSSSIR